MTTQEKNCAIAEMLGFKTNSKKTHWKYPLDNNNYFSTAIAGIHGGWLTQMLRFDSDANWQMEAIDWIEKQGYNVHINSDYWYDDENDKVDRSRLQQICTIMKLYNIIINSAGHGKDDRTDKKKAIFTALYEFSQYLKQQ